MSMHGASSFLRRILFADAAICGAAGVLMALGAGPLAELLALPAPLLRYSGLSLLPFAAALVSLSRRAAIPQAAAIAVIALNIAWVAASVLLLVAGAIEPNGLGVAFVLGQAAAVAGLAEMEYVALRQSSAVAA
jgi:hypothetical protein